MGIATPTPTPEPDARYSIPTPRRRRGRRRGTPLITAGRPERLRDMWVAKYGEFLRFDADDDGFGHPDQGDLDAGAADLALVFAIRPARACAFRRGQSFSRTRYRLRG